MLPRRFIKTDEGWAEWRQSLYVSPGIPRPQNPQQARRNLERYVCRMRPTACGGIFFLYGQSYRCPLYEQCQKDENQYEFMELVQTQRKQQENPLVVTKEEVVAHRKEHAKRLASLLRVFDADRMRDRAKTYSEFKKMVRARAKAESETEPEAYSPSSSKDGNSFVLPCGEQCDTACPHDGNCPYTDEDIDRMTAEWEKSKRKDQRRSHHKPYREMTDEEKAQTKARLQERLQADPEFATKYKNMHLEANRKWRRNNPERAKECSRKAKQREREKLKAIKDTPEGKAKIQARKEKDHCNYLKRKARLAQDSVAAAEQKAKHAAANARWLVKQKIKLKANSLGG